MAILLLIGAFVIPMALERPRGKLVRKGLSAEWIVPIQMAIAAGMLLAGVFLLLRHFRR